MLLMCRYLLLIWLFNTVSQLLYNIISINILCNRQSISGKGLCFLVENFVFRFN